MTQVIDASAILGLMLNESGGAAVAAYLDDAVVSSVNYAEIISKLAHVGMPPVTAAEVVERLQLRIIPFTQRQGLIAGELRPRTARLGFSPGDRACLATALDLGGGVVTLDRSWGGVDLGVPVAVLR